MKSNAVLPLHWTCRRVYGKLSVDSLDQSAGIHMMSLVGSPAAFTDKVAAALVSTPAFLSTIVAQ